MNAPTLQRLRALAAESEPDARDILDDAATALERAAALLHAAVGLLDSQTVVSDAPGLEEAAFMVETREAARLLLKEHRL